MIFDWFKPRKIEILDHKPLWEYEYAESPVYKKETDPEETKIIIERISTKLDEIRHLLQEIYEKEMKTDADGINQEMRDEQK